MTEPGAEEQQQFNRVLQPLICATETNARLPLV